MTRGIRGMTRFFDRQDVFYRTSSFFETAVRKSNYDFFLTETAGFSRYFRQDEAIFFIPR